MDVRLILTRSTHHFASKVFWNPSSVIRTHTSFTNTVMIKHSPPVSPSQSSLHSHFSTRPSHTIRPLPFFHPTRAEFTRHPSGHELEDETHPKTSTSHWSSRASRKNRYTSEPLQIRTTGAGEKPIAEEPLAKPPSLISVEQRFRHAHSRLKVHLTWDISFWVAVTFVLGSSAWVCALSSYVYSKGA